MSDTVGIAAEAGGRGGQNMDKGGGGNKLDEDGGNKPVEGGEKSEKKREERWKCPNPDCNTWATGDVCTECDTSRKCAVEIVHMLADRHDAKYGVSGGRDRRDRGGRRNQPRESNSTDPIINKFEGFRGKLDSRHDKMERVIKLSRDITIESKRIIFTLHRIKNGSDPGGVLQEAENRLAALKKELWRRLALELRGEDHFQFLRNYTAGLQEWIEALSFYHYLCYSKLITWEEVQKELTFNYVNRSKESRKSSCGTLKDGAEDPVAEPEDDKVEPKVAVKEPGYDKVEPKVAVKELEDDKVELKVAVKEPETAADPDKETNEEMKIMVPQTDYVLGLADLTGELMRNAINSLGTGNVEVCFVLLELLQEMHAGFLCVQQDAPYQVGKKVTVLKQSLRKVEDACYAINVRGSEIPKSHLADIFNSPETEQYGS